MKRKLHFLQIPGIIDGSSDAGQSFQTCRFSRTKDLDTYDSDVDDVSNAKAVLLANILMIWKIKVCMQCRILNKHQLDVTDNEITSDSNIILYFFNISKKTIGKCYQNSFYLKKAQQIKPTLYDGIVISDKHVAMPMIDDEETLILEEAKSAKKHKNQNIWKPMGHVFTEVGLKWKPTRRTFTIPNDAWGSNATDIPSSSSLVMTGCPDCSLVSGLWMFKTYDRELLSAHELFRRVTCGRVTCGYLRSELESRRSFDVIVEWTGVQEVDCDSVISPLKEVVRIRLREGVTYFGFKSKEEHEVHLKLVLESLRKEKLYAKFSKLGDALSRKKRVKLRRVRGMILAAQSEAFKQENVLAERLHGLDQQMERKGDESLYFMDRIWVLLVGSVMDEAHASRYLDVKLAMIYIDEIIAKNGILVTINSADGQSGCMVQTLGDIMRACVIDFGGSYHSSIRCTPFEALYGRKLVLTKEKLKAARDRQKSNTDKGRKLLEFKVGDWVMLKVSPWKGVIHFGKKGKLALRYVGPFQILEGIGPAAYSVDKTLRLVEEPIEIGDYKGVYVCVYVDYVGVGTQSIERDRLIGIGVVLDNSFRSLLSDGEMIIEI
ncbi:hypothetical protein Tco_0975743 [Tanacetum coccineum]|uniref:Tf2-1-like SH3-like domain-containing protein n=1 Tax=Tanacetum coccineum TaxID=301880 RepID=A0ABQ5EFG5_9ASTR